MDLQLETKSAFFAFQEYHEYKGSPGENFSEFIAEHDKSYQKLKHFNMELPEGVRAFNLLKSANVRRFRKLG